MSEIILNVPLIRQESNWTCMVASGHMLKAFPYANRPENLDTYLNYATNQLKTPYLKTSRKDASYDNEIGSFFFDVVSGGTLFDRKIIEEYASTFKKDPTTLLNKKSGAGFAYDLISNESGFSDSKMSLRNLNTKGVKFEEFKKFADYFKLTQLDISSPLNIIYDKIVDNEDFTRAMINELKMYGPLLVSIEGHARVISGAFIKKCSYIPLFNISILDYFIEHCLEKYSISETILTKNELLRGIKVLKKNAHDFKIESNCWLELCDPEGCFLSRDIAKITDDMSGDNENFRHITPGRYFIPTENFIALYQMSWNDEIKSRKNHLSSTGFSESEKSEFKKQLNILEKNLPLMYYEKNRAYISENIITHNPSKPQLIGIYGEEV